MALDCAGDFWMIAQSCWSGSNDSFRQLFCWVANDMIGTCVLQRLHEDECRQCSISTCECTARTLRICVIRTWQCVCDSISGCVPCFCERCVVSLQWLHNVDFMSGEIPPSHFLSPLLILECCTKKCAGEKLISIAFSPMS